MKPEGETPPQVQEGTAPIRPSVSAPARRRIAPPEATQELQALDVVELVKTPIAPSIRPSIPSNSSIAPVGLDLKPQRATATAADEEANPTMEIRLPVRRRRLGVVVVGALSACALILVAAGVARVVHASSTPSPEDTPAQATQPTSAPTQDNPAATPPSAAAPGTGASTSAVTPPGASGPTTGTVRLDRPAYPGKVWLDGKKLSSSSSLVSCGTHQIKVGFHRTHSIDVPCGGELGVSK